MYTYFPSKKNILTWVQPEELRFVKDLQAVSAAVHAQAPHVPNPHTIPSQISADSTYFSVGDLANVFFTVPVSQDRQFWLTFQFDGMPYTLTFLSQGYCESPTI